MVYHLKYSPAAEEDLDCVWDAVWEASQNFDIADKYVEDFRNALKQKKKYPKTGSPLTYMGEFTGLYYVTFKEYIAFYGSDVSNIQGYISMISEDDSSFSDLLKANEKLYTEGVETIVIGSYENGGAIGVQYEI